MVATSTHIGLIHLKDLGRQEEALEASTEATGIYRELTRTRPDAFLPDLATPRPGCATARSCALTGSPRPLGELPCASTPACQGRN